MTITSGKIIGGKGGTAEF